MSRSGYSDDLDPFELGRWRGRVASAIRGRRGQAFLREMLAALDALPEKRLITDALVHEGEVCALGAVAVARGIEVPDIDPNDEETWKGVGEHLFGIADAMCREIVFMNDECSRGRYVAAHGPATRYGGTPQVYIDETPEERFIRVRAWVARQIRET